MAAISASRFALLKIDDEYDSDENQKKGKGAQGKSGNQQASAAKKKNKKKKKADQQKENEELRSLAFAKGGKAKPTGVPGSGPGFSVLTASQRSSEDRGSSEDKQWAEWQKVDKGFTADAYESDLQHALMLSKLEDEEHKKVKATGGDEEAKGQGQKSKKKKKDKPAAMSLGEFQQTGGVEKPKPEQNGSGNGFEDHHRKPTTSISEPDPAFFNKVEADTQKILRKEQIQEEYRKQYIVENARTQQFQDDLEKKDTEIERLKEVNKKLEADLKEVKERNQQLCLILAQGEMKGKTTVLLELDQLKQVRDELTAEVSNLTTELEKERSKVHSLKSAAEKNKGGKHGK